MLSPELRQAIAPRAQRMNLLWGAFLAATVFYVALAMFAVGGAEPVADGATPPLDPWLLTAVLGAAAVGAAAGSFLLPRLLLPAGRPPKLTAAGSRQGPTAAAAHLPPSERELLELLPAYQTTMVITWAMREAVAVFGVVAAILTRQPAIAVPFAAVAFALLALARPRVVGFLEGRKGRG